MEEKTRVEVDMTSKRETAYRMAAIADAINEMVTKAKKEDK